VKGEPIVCSPTDAIRCYYGSGMDALAIGSFLLEKRG
jgi:carbamoyltransferase